MNITSLEFAAFVLVVLGLYYVLPHRPQNYLLLLASYLFLVSWNIQFALVFFVLTAVNYALGRKLAKNDDSSRKMLYFGIVFNIAALVFFKYSDFYIPSALDALKKLGITLDAGSIHILLPVGLSFFVVQAISYLLDVSRGAAKPVVDPVIFAVYMAYFPRLVSGPIERARDLVPCLEKKRTVDRTQLSGGAVLLAQGLVRKIFIADLLTLTIPPDLFVAPAKYTPPQLAIGLLTYAFSLYNDFAGYTLIVRGISRLFGIPLSENFDVPYLSRSFAEFWQRWHITLSNWLRDYVFIPTTRFLLKRKYAPTSTLCIFVPPLATMFVSALWHNMSLNLLLWGVMHGTYLAVERAITVRKPPATNNTQSSWRSFVGTVFIFLLVLLAWVPFRADVPATLQYWGGLLDVAGWYNALRQVRAMPLVLGGVTLGGLIGLSIALDLTHRRFGNQAFQKLPVPLQALVLNVAVFMLVLATMAQTAAPPFVYQGF